MKRTISNIIKLTIVFTFTAFFSFGIENEREVKKQFEEKQYNLVLGYFEQHFQAEPENRQYAYYYGVCLSETGQMGQKALETLLKASSGEVPNDVWLYIGKNFHALSDFPNALNHYQHYGTLASKKEKKITGLDSLINLTRQGENPFQALVLVEKPAEPVDTISQVKVPRPEIPQVLLDTLIEFRLTPDIFYRHIRQFRDDVALGACIDGWLGERKIDSLTVQTSRLRMEYAGTSGVNDRQHLAGQIVDCERQLLELQPQVEQQFLLAREKELKVWEKVTPEQLMWLSQTNDSLLLDWNLKHQPVVIEEPVDDQYVEADSILSDSLSVKISADSLTAEIVLPVQPEQMLVYKVQIGTYRGKLPASVDKLFQRLAILRKIDKAVNDKGDDVYTVGELRNFQDAIKLQQQIRLEGIKDAFVVVYHSGKRITLEEAKKLSEK